MRLARRGKPLFPHTLTDRWHRFSDVDAGEYFDALQFEQCPWSRAPKTLDEFIEASNARQEWIKNNNAEPPSYWSCTLTHSLVEEIVRNIKEIQDVKRNT